MDLKLLEFLGREVPNSIEDIRESLDLLIGSVDSAIDLVGEKVNKAYLNRDFKKIQELSSKSEELNLIIKSLENVTSELDNIIDNTNIDDNKNIDEERKDICKISEKDSPNYSDYLVDTEVEHNLYEDLTHKRPCGFKVEGEKIEIRDWKGCLVETINYLAKKNPHIIRSFVNDPKMNGKKVVYFSKSKLPTMRSAREIKAANIYIETNLSANGIRNLLIKVLKRCNLKLSDYKLYFKADYSELH